jgi:response regulator RpfG family c-di-GMP phosphodiesterase
MMILCIDDEPLGLQVRKLLLQYQGYEVLTAKNGIDGLQLFVANPVHAVVLDYSMPGMTGDQIATEMKRLKPTVKILLLSAYVDLPEEALKFVDKRVVKGVAPTTFLEELQKLLSY